MTTREILTIQLGHYANFVGTHWWNIQETNFSYDPENPSEINADVLYRVGELEKKTTFTPRLLIADLKGTFGYLSEEGNLLDLAQKNLSLKKPEILWEEDYLETTVLPKEEKSSFVKSLEKTADNDEEFKFDLENESNKWVDYLVPRFHQRTVNVITDYEHNSSCLPFDIFPYGQNLWKTKQFTDQFTDKIRAYTEECDSMQGFQVLMDANDGFSGLGASCVEYLRDEYGKSILTLPVLDAAPRAVSVADHLRLINTVLCWQKIGENSSLFSPLCCDEIAWLVPKKFQIFDNLTYKPDIKYHTSALLATALDTLTLRYRQKKYSMSALSDLCADLNKVGRKAVATSLSLPFPMVMNKDLIDVLDDFDGKCLWTSLTPGCSINNDNVMQSLALRGIPEDRLKQPLKDAKGQMEKAAYRCSTVHEMMSLYIDCSSYSAATHLTTINQPLQIKDPYPKIFNSNVQENGNICDSNYSGAVKSVPVMAGFHSGKFLADMYESLHCNAKKLKSIRRFHSYQDSGLEQDEFDESVNNLLDCKENYEDHYV